MRCFVGVISIEEKKSMEYKRQIIEMLSKILVNKNIQFCKGVL